ncbi:MAG: glycosyltransferase family 2 protein, partial [Bacteroidota bacterium]|nr:glycosyltransferase family 2 protein [Bacteroidota bacterium]
MRISIVIPAHNEAAFLKDCLDSISVQTYLPNEVIVVDDNSSDDTYTIAQNYAQTHDWIKVIQRSS